MVHFLPHVDQPWLELFVASFGFLLLQGQFAIYMCELTCILLSFTPIAWISYFLNSWHDLQTILLPLEVFWYNFKSCCFICSKALQEGTNSTIFKIYVFVVGIYAGIQLFISFLLRIPFCRQLTEPCDRWSMIRLIKWMHEVFTNLLYYIFLVLKIQSYCLLILSSF